MYKVGEKQRQKVRRYKLSAERQKALKALPTAAPTFDTHSASEGSSIRKKRRVKINAASAARRSWEATHAEELAAQQTMREESAQQQKEKDEARKRRLDHTAKLNKRTKRGQPILGFEVERMLDTLQRAR